MINEKYKSEYQERFAFIIGIDKYLNVGALEHAEADAKSIKETLVNDLGYKEENIVILLGEEATKEKLCCYYFLC